MALFDFLKRKEELEKAQQKKQPEKKAEKVLVKKETEKKVEKAEKVSAVKTGKANSFSYTIIKEPHISEKATILAEENKYTFKVYNNSNKPEIKKAVEGIYGVDVLDVKVIKIPKKKRKLGRTEGFRKGFSKAVITIK